MSWAVGYDSNNKRDIGYGVPAKCDHPDCDKDIDRGLSYVCGGDVYGGEYGCGLFFCEDHRQYHEFENGDFVQVCECCADDHKRPFTQKPDVQQWINWKLTDESWQQWRDENPDEVEKLKAMTA